jgi:hypothetical protein
MTMIQSMAMPTGVARHVAEGVPMWDRNALNLVIATATDRNVQRDDVKVCANYVRSMQ